VKAPREISPDVAPLTFLDLFSGCGGFALGLERVGFRCAAAIDFNPEAIETFRVNFPHVPVVLRRDLTRLHPRKLAQLIGCSHVDVIVGGPPCQGFSTVRQVDSSNHGPRVRRDKRRFLYREFLRYVGFFKPRVFIMENVLGLQSAAKGKFFTIVQQEARSLGYRVHSQVEEAWKLGAPQKRRRQLIVGVRSDVPGYFPTELQPSTNAWSSKHPEDYVTLWDAIGDLPPLKSGAGADESDYDLPRRKAGWARHRARFYLSRVVEVHLSRKLTAHRARPHSDRDLRDFSRLREGEHSGEAIARGISMEFPYSRHCFGDRYKRQHRGKLCSTIVAHLSKDGLMFIHPTQNRSLTPREAARIQTFPDWFSFPVAQTHQFRLIGNALPPLVAEAVGLEIEQFLTENPSVSEAGPVGLPLASVRTRDHNQLDIPSHPREASERLLLLARATLGELRSLEADVFRRGWFALLFLYPELHPDSALDHGHDRIEMIPRIPEAAAWRERYIRSGWPVALDLIGREAWRRYRTGALSRNDLYCVAAQQAGLQPWNA
jgi:DNA (cytosine-5)-methyltransferase 1